MNGLVMGKRGGLLKKLKTYPLWARGAAVGLIVLALVLQANYAVIGQMAATLFGPSFGLKNVPPLEQNQALADPAAADLNSAVVNPILASEQIAADKPKGEYEDKSKRTEHTKTIVGANGETTKRISLAEPMHHKKDGVWDDLKPASSKAGNTVSRAPAYVPKVIKQVKDVFGGNTYVYKGVAKGKDVYVGITNNVAKRQYQHGDRFQLVPLNNQPLTRMQARSVEEALIIRNPHYQNKIHSISPKNVNYQGYLDWGAKWLDNRGL